MNFLPKRRRPSGAIRSRCKLSFIDFIPRSGSVWRRTGFPRLRKERRRTLHSSLRRLAGKNGIEVSACGNLDLAAAGIPRAKCIDDALVSRITGWRLRLKRDTGQRDDCYCVKSVDIGAYDTCGNGCRYCYANASDGAVERNRAGYDPAAPMLCGTLLPEDRVAQRAAKIRPLPAGEPV